MLIDAGDTGCCALLPVVLSSGADVDAMGAVQSGLPRSEQRDAASGFQLCYLDILHLFGSGSCDGVCFMVFFKWEKLM